MAENLKSESGVLAKASQTVDTHRAEQNAISQRVQAAAADSQSGWQGQGAAAVAQVVQQYAEDGRRIDQALAKLSDALKSTDQAYQSRCPARWRQRRRLPQPPCLTPSHPHLILTVRR